MHRYILVMCRCILSMSRCISLWIDAYWLIWDKQGLARIMDRHKRLCIDACCLQKLRMSTWLYSQLYTKAKQNPIRHFQIFLEPNVEEPISLSMGFESLKTIEYWMRYKVLKLRQIEFGQGKSARKIACMSMHGFSVWACMLISL